MMKAVKFGGSSLANSAQFFKVIHILQADPSRKYIVLSAPGARFQDDSKITDLLYLYYDLLTNEKDAFDTRKAIYERYHEIITGLQLDFDLSHELDVLTHAILSGAGRDYAASRGEYLCGRILAAYLHLPFLDPADMILFDHNGNFLAEETNLLLQSKLSHFPQAVIPGFYGAKADGTIVTFPRGGSDITGALVAKAVRADLYENWTDVSGFLLADPRIVSNPVAIGVITYQELHGLARMGACVLHEDTIAPAMEANIPIHIRNTNHPEDPGTMIISRTNERLAHGITGIAGKKGYCSLTIQKNALRGSDMLNSKVPDLLGRKGLPFEPFPSVPGSAAYLLPQEQLLKKGKSVLCEIQRLIHPDLMSLEKDLALIAIGCRGFSTRKKLETAVLHALQTAAIPILMLDQSDPDLAMIIGVQNHCYEQAVRVIYDQLVRLRVLGDGHNPQAMQGNPINACSFF